jgi:glucokinase
MEIGQLRIGSSAPDGADPEAARTIEELASGWAIGRRGTEAARDQHARGLSSPLVTAWNQGSQVVTAKMVVDAADRGDPDAIRIIDHATMALARGLAVAVNLVAPQRIVLGGGVSLAGEGVWYEPIRRRLDQWVFAPLRGSYDVVRPELGEEVVIHGAIALAARGIGNIHDRTPVDRA